MMLLEARYDCLSVEYQDLNRQLRELVLDVRLERKGIGNGTVKDYKKFVKFMTFLKSFKN
jgi:hypothetical protein